MLVYAVVLAFLRPMPLIETAQIPVDEVAELEKVFKKRFRMQR